MIYAILQISAAAYGDIRARLVALDEKLKPEPTYASEYIQAGAPELLRFGPVAFEALPAVAYSADPESAVIRAARALDACASEFGLESGCCGEHLDELWTAIDRLKAAAAAPPVDDPILVELRSRLGELVLSVGALAKAMPDSVILEHEDAVNRVAAAAERLSHAEIEAILGGGGDAPRG